MVAHPRKLHVAVGGGGIKRLIIRGPHDSFLPFRHSLTVSPFLGLEFVIAIVGLNLLLVVGISYEAHLKVTILIIVDDRTKVGISNGEFFVLLGLLSGTPRLDVPAGLGGGTGGGTWPRWAMHLAVPANMSSVWVQCFLVYLLKW